MPRSEYASLKAGREFQTGAATMNKKLFISYRRSDSEQIVHRMYDRLQDDFGAGTVFLDIDQMPPTDFREHIRKEVRKAAIVLVVMGSNWLPSILRRSAEANDWVRIEVETALAEKIPIAPIWVGDGRFPGLEGLPPSIAQLSNINALRVDGKEDFHVHMDRLAYRLAAEFNLNPRLERNQLARPNNHRLGAARPDAPVTRSDGTCRVFTDIFDYNARRDMTGLEVSAELAQAMIARLRLDAIAFDKIVFTDVQVFHSCRVPGCSGLINSFRLFQAEDVLRDLIHGPGKAQP
jgi:hypothetical protein